MRIFLFIVTGFVIFFTGEFSNAQRIGHYDEDWKTIKTPHFDIVINAKQLDLGRYYAHAAEKAYQNLAGVFEHMTNKIVIVVNDTTDISNGYATRIPYPHVMAFAVISGDHDSLSENGDWAEILMTHELTHIMQFEPANGIYSWLRPIFGSVVAPNMLMPAWWKEGMAVETETQFTNTGRTRSVFQDATLRSIVLDKKLSQFDLPQANEVLPSWPYGARPYLFGSLFYSQLVTDTKQLQSINHLAKRQGERVPYFIEEPIHELNGLNYETTYNKGLFSVEQQATLALKKLKEVQPTEIKIIDEAAQSTARPSIAVEQNQIIYLESVKDDNIVTLVDLEGKKVEINGLPKGAISGLQFHPTGQKFIYTKIDNIDSSYKFSDLYEYNFETKKSERLTTGARARSVSYSSDGKLAVFLNTEGGKIQISTFDFMTKQIQPIISSNLGERYESPIFWDENTLLATKINQYGDYVLYKIDLASKTEKSVDLKFKQVHFLKKINKSLYFVSSQNGVNNIYRSRDLKNATPMTNILTGIWSYDVAPDEKTAWASVMTSSGFQVAKLNLKPFEKELPKISNKISERYKFNEKEFNYAETTVQDYAAGSYLWPSYWIPFVSTSSSAKGVYFQAQTNGFDPIKRHQYSAVASYDSELNKGNFSGLYLNSTQFVPFKLTSTVKSFALGSNLNIVENTTHTASILPDLFSLNKHLALDLGAEIQRTYFNTVSQHTGAYFELNYLNYSQSIFEISPESGWGGSLKFEHLIKNYDETNGLVAEDYDKAQFSLVGFTSKWLPARHAIKARVSGLSTFQSVLGRFGANTATQFFEQDGLTPQFVIRGYNPSQFFGRNIWNTNFEYRFPISTLERGSGSDAYFFKRIIGVFVTDGIGVDGYGMAEDLTLQALKANESIWSSGLELKLESTIGYILPMNFVLGFYLPYSPKYSSSSQIGLSLQIGTL